ncbi:MAG: ABC-2 family transporter protein [Eubacterium sp.]|nr:ABC-2 family transporter protein [Eubacterium sp.]
MSWKIEHRKNRNNGRKAPGQQAHDEAACGRRCGVFRLYRHYVSILLRSAMQYKASFLLGAAGQFLVSFNGLLGLLFIFARFSSVKGYTCEEALLCYGVMLLGFSVAQCIARGLESFPFLIKSGEFDRILVRPRSVLLQVLGSRFETNRLFRILLACGMLCYSLRHCLVVWTLQKAAVLILMLFGIIALFVGLFLLGAAISFFTIEDGGFLNVLIYGGSEHGKYPVDIYGKQMLKFCTYVIPYALVQYYPLQYLLGRTARWEYALYPLGAAVFLLACYGAWRFGMRHYQSAGS